MSTEICVFRVWVFMAAVLMCALTKTNQVLWVLLHQLFIADSVHEQSRRCWRVTRVTTVNGGALARDKHVGRVVINFSGQP